MSVEPRVAITGISGRFGRRLAQLLHRTCTVVGIDRRPLHGGPRDVETHQIDIRRQRCEEIFRAGAFDAVVHLNVMHDPRTSSEEHHTFNIKGTTRVMDYCVRHRIPKLILLSTANVYGPRAENPQFLTEDAPLMGGTRFGEIRDLIALDMCGQSFFWKHPEVETVILRPVHIIGAVKNAPSNYLRLKHIPRLAGFDPMIQLIHEDDVARAIIEALKPGLRGVFNVAGCMPVPLSDILSRLDANIIDFPHFLAEPTLERMWRMRLTSFPPPEIDHLRYVCMVDDQPARQVLGYQPRFELDATLAHLRLTQGVELR